MQTVDRAAYYRRQLAAYTLALHNAQQSEPDNTELLEYFRSRVGAYRRLAARL